MSSWLRDRVIFPLHQRRRGGVFLPWYRKFLEMERWPEERLRDWQEGRLREIFIHAAREVPYYRDCFRAAGVDLRDPLAWERVPILLKETARSKFNELQAETARGPSATVRTSGSTGTPMTWRFSWETGDIHRAVEFRGRRWWEFRIGEPQAWLWGRDEFSGPRQRLGATLVWNKHLLPVLDLSRETVKRFYERLLRWRPRFLYGYPSGFVQFARLCEEAGLPLQRVRAGGVITTAEVLSDSHRDYLRAAFGCPIINEYGCSETQTIAFECPAGSMHIHADALRVEFIRDGKPVAPGEYGEVVVTDFFNRAMPILRYRIGDLGRARPGPCPCGRTLPRMELSVGRELEMLRLPDGRLLHPEIFTPPHEDPLFHWMERFQVVQEGPRRLSVQVVTAPDHFEEVRRNFIRLVRRHIGDSFSVEVQRVREIPRDPSGKLRYFICRPAAVGSSGSGDAHG